MEPLSAFVARQLACWPLAARNFAALAHCRRRDIQVPVRESTATISLLYNPERVRSTAAKVDAASVAARPCFLCPSNRPNVQLVHPGLNDLGYDILLNPYPILSPHFTIVAHEHKPQLLPLHAMLEAADRFPDLVFFFNGAKSGASAPDHLHFQAVARRDLPLILRAEVLHKSAIGAQATNQELGIVHPASFVSLIGNAAPTPHLTPDNSQLSALSSQLSALSSQLSALSSQLLNSFVFKRADGLLQQLHFPRLRHRASTFPEPMVSPGALDVAGILVTVRQQDFDSLTPLKIAQIFHETCPQTLT